MAKFKVLHGAHSEGGKIYRVGDVVDSKTDLLKQNRAMPPKFARLDSGTGEEVFRHSIPQGVHPTQDVEQVHKVHTQESIKGVKKEQAPDTNDGYEDLSEQDLRELLEGEEVHLRGNESKAELIKLLRDNS